MSDESSRLVGAVIELHRLTLEHVDPLVAIWEASEAIRARWSDNPRDDLMDQLAGDEAEVAWAIHLDGEVVGLIQHYQELDPEYRHAGMDIYLADSTQGRGVGVDAVRTLSRYLIEVLGHHRLIIDPAADNEPAIRCYAKVGFRPVGVMRQYERGPDGTFHDGLLMDMLADELT